MGAVNESRCGQGCGACHDAPTLLELFALNVLSGAAFIFVPVYFERLLNPDFTPDPLAVRFNDSFNLLLYTTVLFACAPLRVHLTTRRRVAEFCIGVCGGITLFPLISSTEPTSLATTSGWTPQSYWIYSACGAASLAIIAYATWRSASRWTMLLKLGLIGAYLLAALAVTASHNAGTPTRLASVHLHHYFIAWLIAALLTADDALVRVGAGAAYAVFIQGASVYGFASIIELGPAAT